MLDTSFLSAFMLTTLAQAGSGSSGGGASGNPLSLVFPVLFMFVLVYFIILRPQRKEEKERQNKISTLQRGDKVVTIGGIHGSVEAINQGESTVTVTVGPKLSLTFDKSAIRTVVSKGREKAEKPEKAE